MTRIERIGAATLYLGDCREIAPTLPRPAALISDPPYGQGLKSIRARTISPVMGVSKRLCGQAFGPIVGDDAPFDPAPWLDAAPAVLLWGAHRFGRWLPPGTTLVWDKNPSGYRRTQGDGETAWLSGPVRAVRIYRQQWTGIVTAGRERTVHAQCNDPRWHPTEKPTLLMEWCITQARVPAGGTILDPYMGSGSTLVAAVRRGHPCIGIEIELLYFETACERVAAAQRQSDLFVQQPAPAHALPDLFAAGAAD